MSLFTKILNKEIPGHIVWEDEHAFAILTIAPNADGHTLVIPRQEIDHWIDVPTELTHHLIDVSQKIASTLQNVYSPVKVGVMIAGLEVRHVHYHLIPINALTELIPGNEIKNYTADRLADQASRIRTALQNAGHGEFVPKI